MTIIAVRNGVMACDSCWNDGEIVDVLATKIHRAKSGAIIGQAGDNDAREIMRLLDHVKVANQLPSRNDLMSTRIDFAGIILLPTNQIFKISSSHLLPEYVDQDVGIWEIQGFPYAATGHGWEIAMGAFARGATAVQAVAACILHDTTCRGPIHSLSILKKKK